MLESPDQYVDGSPLDRLILTGLLVGALSVLVARRDRVGALFRANGPLVIFFLYCAVSVLWSDFPFVAFKRWTKAFGNVAMVLVMLTELDPIAAVKRVLTRVGFLLIPLSVLFIKYYPDLGRGYNVWTWKQYYVGVASTKNGLGAICLVFGLSALWRFLVLLRSKPRPLGPLVAHGVVLVMSLWLFGKANSATSLACFFVGGALIAFTGRRVTHATLAAVHAMTAGIVTLGLLAVFFDPDGHLLQAMGRDATLTGRTELWNHVLRMADNAWLGTGFESFWLGDRAKAIWEIYWWHPNEAHNGYLEIYLTLGWFGVALLVVVMASGYRNVTAALRQVPEVGNLRLAYFTVAVLYNLTEAAFKVMHPVWVLFVFAIIAIPTVVRVEGPEGACETGPLAAGHGTLLGMPAAGPTSVTSLTPTGR
jgi:O-antigen ligase